MCRHDYDVMTPMTGMENAAKGAGNKAVAMLSSHGRLPDGIEPLQERPGPRLLVQKPDAQQDRGDELVSPNGLIQLRRVPSVSQSG